MSAKQQFLVQFDYQHYCQGWEWVRGYQMLVTAPSFEEACDKVRCAECEQWFVGMKGVRFVTATNFVNCTL